MVVPEAAVAVAVACVEEEAVAVAVAEEGVKLGNLGTSGWTTDLAAGWGAAKQCAQGVRPYLRFSSATYGRFDGDRQKQLD